MSSLFRSTTRLACRAMSELRGVADCQFAVGSNRVDGVAIRHPGAAQPSLFLNAMLAWPALITPALRVPFHSQ
ncbi:hypothetical protein L682_17715 [Aquipseudomonas alcaligenes OT 69]|nr:hypothetical protein L682_17715 [Pseudomonas alcaligenes OT 69]